MLLSLSKLLRQGSVRRTTCQKALAMDAVAGQFASYNMQHACRNYVMFLLVCMDHALVSQT